jgi:hypothetical protein
MGVSDAAQDPAAAGDGGMETTAMVVETMAATLLLARALLAAGHRIDLDGVEREIGDLCAETVGLPRADGQALRPALEHLLREVEALEADIADRAPLAPG